MRPLKITHEPVSAFKNLGGGPSAIIPDAASFVATGDVMCRWNASSESYLSKMWKRSGFLSSRAMEYSNVPGSSLARVICFLMVFSRSSPRPSLA